MPSFTASMNNEVATLCTFKWLALQQMLFAKRVLYVFTFGIWPTPLPHVTKRTKIWNRLAQHPVVPNLSALKNPCAFWYLQHKFQRIIRAARMSLTRQFTSFGGSVSGPTQAKAEPIQCGYWSQCNLNNLCLSETLPPNFFTGHSCNNTITLKKMPQYTTLPRRRHDERSMSSKLKHSEYHSLHWTPWCSPWRVMRAVVNFSADCGRSDIKVFRPVSKPRKMHECFLQNAETNWNFGNLFIQFKRLLMFAKSIFWHTLRQFLSYLSGWHSKSRLAQNGAVGAGVEALHFNMRLELSSNEVLHSHGSVSEERSIPLEAYVLFH